MDVVLIDAPCSGTGVWRRKPDSKWRLTPDQIEARIATQRDIIAMAAPLVKPGGRLVYVTCSVLHSENGAQVSAFLGAHPEFADQAVAASAFPAAVTFPQSASRIGPGIQLSPHIHATDGFYIAFMQRKAGPIGK
jgi:16S rRNA (cytosine967-C5)-methyltransferase